MKLLLAAFGLALLFCTAPIRAQEVFGLIGNGLNHLAQEKEAGLNARVVRVSWKDLFPTETRPSADYIRTKKEELKKLKSAGFGIIVDFGLQDVPRWIHTNYKNTRYINQHGDAYAPDNIDEGDANLIFNRQLRKVAERYFETLLSEFGSDIDYLRLGGAHWGELTYPHHVYNEKKNCYWAYDALAQQSCPAKNWKPGDPSPHGEATKFLNWYLDALVDFQNWQITSARRHFKKPLLMLYPSWGIRPGQIELAIKTNLNGSTSAEINGEVPRGFDFARQIAAMKDDHVIVATTWIDADATQDDQPNPAYWSPVKYLSSLADQHQPPLKKFGENTGRGSKTALDLTFKQAKRYRLTGVQWFRQEELGQKDYATLSELKSAIESARRK